MKAVVRAAIAALVTGLALGPLPASAQDAPATNSTATEQPDTIGPRELQNFNLQGQVTRQAQPQEPPASAPAREQPRPSAPAASDSPAPVSVPSTNRQSASAREPGQAPVALPERTRRPTSTTTAPTTFPAGPSVTTVLPPIDDSPVGGADQAPADRGFPVLPWLAALVIAGGLGFFYWRHRQRAALAGGADMDDYAAPRSVEPQPVPRPQPQPPSPRPDPVPSRDLGIGLVSTRLRPWLELGFRPLNCVVDHDNVVIEFELELFNSGNSPARAILVEASYFNAGPDQDQRIRQFYDHPVAEGGRAISLGPLKRMVIRNRLVTPRDQVQEYDVEGRKLFVPLIGFNALYRWSSGEGQTSASFMLGRKTGADKMAPLRLDMGDRQFHGLGDQPLPVTVRH